MWYLGGTHGVLHGTPWVFRGSFPGTSGLLEGYSDGASGRLHARKRAKLEGCASALEGVLCGVPFAEGALGADYIEGHSMGSSAHSRGFKAVLRGCSGGL